MNDANQRAQNRRDQLHHEQSVAARQTDVFARHLDHLHHPRSRMRIQTGLAAQEQAALQAAHAEHAIPHPQVPTL